MKRIVLIAGLALSPVAGPSAAQDGAGPAALAGALFQRLDADGDGRVTQSEMTEARRAGFARADANGDGVLSASEIAARQERARRFARIADDGATGRLARLDADGDGALSFEEFDADTPLFRLIDVDEDGAVSRAEFDRARAALRQ